VDYTEDEVKPATKPETGARAGKGKMDDTEFNNLINGLISEAVEYVDGTLSPLRAKAADYYKGEPFGNEEPGRSQVVLTEVHDGVQAVLPSLLRVVFGSERAVEFKATGPEDEEQAAQATDYVNMVFQEDNDGFLHTLSVLKDGLVKKTGVFKWGWDESSKKASYQLENVTQEQLEMLGAEEGIEITSIEQTSAEVPGEMDQTTGQPITMPSPALHSVEFTRVEKDGRADIMSLPPEELIFVRSARGPKECLFMGHRTEKTRGDLLALGISETDLDAHGSSNNEVSDNPENISRSVDGMNTTDVEAGKANDKILYIEGWALLDYDGDGEAELRKVCTIGPAYYPVKNIPTDDVPIAIFCPDPEPHTLVGRSWADRLMDLQLIKSSLCRSSLDSLAASIYPRTGYVEGQVNIMDVMNTAIGAPIRMKSPNAIQPITHNFVGKEALPFLAYMDEVKEQRTGQNKGATALDADALQSSTKGAVDAVVTAAQAQTEMLARIFAETALKPMFKGLLKLLVQYQPRARVVKLRNRWVEVDPRTWNADMDMTVNVALGSGLVEQKIAVLFAHAAKQEQILATMGMDNPLVTLSMYRNTLAKIAELQGYKDTAQFYKPVNDQEVAAKMAQQSQQQAPSPEMVIAQAQIQIEQMKAERQLAIEQAKMERDLAIKQAELELRREEMLLEDDRQRDKQAADIQLKIKELELKHAADLHEQQISAEIERERMTTQAASGEAQ
jgi:hypothetical protein